MEKSRDSIVKKAFESAQNYEKKCTGCAQTTIAGIFEALGIENDDVFRSASGLADGLGANRRLDPVVHLLAVQWS